VVSSGVVSSGVVASVSSGVEGDPVSVGVSSELELSEPSEVESSIEPSVEVDVSSS